jgi:hypothetical protein
MYRKGMHTTIRRYIKTCKSCQVNKRHSRKYGHLPSKLVITTPWKALCVDLIGPYTLKAQEGPSIDFMCLIMIDPTTSWFKILELPTVDLVTTVPPVGKGKKVTSSTNTTVAEPYFDKSSAQISDQISNLHFQFLCNTYGIKHKPTSAKNPQANAIQERIYAVLGNMLRTFNLEMTEMVKASDMDILFSDAAWANCSTYHTVLKASPGAAIFG